MRIRTSESPLPGRGRLRHLLLLERVEESTLSREELVRRERMFRARNYCWAWFMAGALQLVMLAVPADGRREGVVAVLAGVGMAASLIHVLVYERLPMVGYFLSLSTAWVVAGIALWGSGEQTIVAVLTFPWIGVFAAATVGLRAIVTHLVIATVVLTIAIAARDDGVSVWFGPLAIVAIVTMGGLVYAVRARNERLFRTVVREREARDRTARNRQVVAELGAAALSATSLEGMWSAALDRLEAEGYRCTIEPADPPRDGAFDIPGTGRALVACGATPPPEEGELLASVGRILGLAEQRFAEEARRVRLESELADARRLEAIGRLAGGVAHDFNNVLTVIIGNTELALQEMPPEAAAGGKLREVLDASHRAAALVAQLLALGSRQLVNRGAVDVGTVVLDLEGILRRLLGEGSTLHVEIEPGTPPCHADTTQLEQVVLNLVANARDAMPGGGETTISVGRVTDPPDAPTLEGDFVALTVHDTGIGMDEETRRRAFEPFFTSKPFGSGTGLGLATVHGILHQSAGGAAIASEPGRGTTFRAYLPVHVPASEPETAAPA